jgi:hypothetical protein
MADTTMTLAGIYSGLKLSSTCSSGTISFTASKSGRTGYKISTGETSDGKTYDIIALTSDLDADDPPSLVVGTNYSQTVEIAEVDLEVRYTDIPAGTSLQVVCSEKSLSISKQGISGSSLIGSSAKKLQPLEATIDLNLWITATEAIQPTSALTLNLSKIEGGSGKPVKKTLLDKIQINLSN